MDPRTLARISLGFLLVAAVACGGDGAVAPTDAGVAGDVTVVDVGVDIGGGVDVGNGVDALTDARPSDARPADARGAPDAGTITMTPAEFERARAIYFDRCAGCHGLLRAGATGPNIQPDRTRVIGGTRLVNILTNGLSGGMPAWVRSGVLTAADVELLSRYVQLPPPAPPPRPLDEVRRSWSLRVPVSARPTRPVTTRNWENFVGVILRDVGRVAILDGDRHELVGIVETGFAVHILRSSSSGRYFYAIGRDGRVTLIDLWPEQPTLVAQAQGCSDARSVESSRFRGYEDRLVVEGCYWPPQYVVFDGLTLEPRAVVPLPMDTYDTHENLPEVRVASIIASRFDPLWVMSLKETGYVALIDYSMPNFPIVARIGAERFLHDGGWDHTGRYYMVAANQRNRVEVIDVRERRLAASFVTGSVPHPGRGANWLDPEHGWVNVTSHVGIGRLAIYGADPEASPANAWRVVRQVSLPNSGSLFVKTHPTSPWVWVDFTMSDRPEGARQVCVYSKSAGAVHRCWEVATHGMVTHFEYNRAGTEVWVSVWDRQGEIVVYDDRTLREITRIRGDWLVTPTGKFNVYNTAHDVY